MLSGVPRRGTCNGVLMASCTQFRVLVTALPRAGADSQALAESAEEVVMSGIHRGLLSWERNVGFRSEAGRRVGVSVGGTWTRIPRTCRNELQFRCVLGSAGGHCGKLCAVV